MEPLLVLRGVQALGGAATPVAAFELLDAGGGGPGRRLWVAASVFGAAIGPALGGALTEAFDWRAIFLAQVPLVLPALGSPIAACRASAAAERRRGGASPGLSRSPAPARWRWRSSPRR